MSLLLTVYQSPAWKTFVNVSGLTLINEAIPVPNTNAAILQPAQSVTTIPVLLSGVKGEQKLILAAVQAEHYLADALENGRTLEEAAQEWEQKTSEVLVLQRQQRKKLQLFNVHQALANPAVFRLLLAPDTVVSEYPEHPLISTFSLLAASQYLAQQPELQSLNLRLQASALSLCESEKLVLNIDQIILQNYNKSVAAEERDKTLQDLEKVSAEYQAVQQEYTKLKYTLKVISEERDLILTQLQQVQEQLEQYYLSLQAERQDNKHALLARDKQQAKESAKLEAELRKTKARAANAEYAGMLLHQELDKLKKSISWKAARPVRVLGRLVRKKDPTHDKLMQDVGLLLSSEYFDVEWYLRTYPDVAESQINPAEHYLRHGAAEGRVPGPLFDGNWYLQHYPDVAEANINPLMHFILYGQQEGRSTSPILLTNNSKESEDKCQ